LVGVLAGLVGLLAGLTDWLAFWFAWLVGARNKQNMLLDLYVFPVRILQLYFTNLLAPIYALRLVEYRTPVISMLLSISYRLSCQIGAYFLFLSCNIFIISLNFKVKFVA
jgi:hypothetical protein